MTDYVIPCDTFARLSNIVKSIPLDIDQRFKCIRIDNGVAVATNRKFLAAEKIGNNPGIVHIIATPGLIENCKKEAPFNSNLTITVIEELKHAVAKTTFGYIEPGNCCLWQTDNFDFNRWRSIVMQTKQPATINRGGMFWDAENIANLASSSPSGRVVFEEMIDTQSRPTLMRDVTDYNWFGMFDPYSTADNVTAAVLPLWMVQ